MINEVSKRKANFDERNAERVTLADCQTWAIPKPWFEVRPVFRDGRAIDAYSVLTCGPDLDALVEALGDCDDIYEQVSAVATLAAHLLGWHYDLSDADLNSLLAFRQADAASLDWMRRIVEIATGRSGPKVSSAGSD
jgi:hypothetical protein